MNHSLFTVVINYQTPDLLKISIESFRRFYPDTNLLIFDNGSRDNSTKVIDELKTLSPDHTEVIIFDKNIFHGPAMHYAIENFNADYFFFLDSDTETYKWGFLEEMISLLNSSDSIYGAGRFLTINKRGFQSSKGFSFPAPAYMMIKKICITNFPPLNIMGCRC